MHTYKTLKRGRQPRDVRGDEFFRAPSTEPRPPGGPFKLAQASRARFGKQNMVRPPSPSFPASRPTSPSVPFGRLPAEAKKRSLGFGSASRVARRAPRRISGVGTASRPASGRNRARTRRERLSASARRSRASSPAVAASRRAPPRATANPIFAGWDASVPFPSSLRRVSRSESPRPDRTLTRPLPLAALSTIPRTAA